MSEKQFKESKSALAFSQGLLDRMRASQKAEEMPETAPQGTEEPEMVEDTTIEETPQGEPEMEATEEVVEEPMEEEEEIVEEPENDVELVSEGKLPIDIKKSIQSGLSGMSTFFNSMGDYFKSEEQREAERAKKDEENKKSLKIIEEQIKSIVED